MRRWFVGIYLALVSLAGAGAVGAASFTINPAKVVVRIAPGETQVIAVNIKNPAATPQEFSLSVSGATQDQAGRPRFASGVSEAESWVVARERAVTVPARGVVAVEFLVAIPSSAAGGIEHQVGLVVEQLAAGQDSIGLTARLVSLVSITVAGTVNEALELKRWQMLLPFAFRNKWPFALELKNIGSASVPLTGQVIIRRGQAIIGEQAINLGSPLLPGVVRAVNPALDLSGTIFWPGLYSVELKAHYGYTAQTISRTIFIWYWPAVFIGLILAALGGLSCFFVYRWRFRLRS